MDKQLQFEMMKIIKDNGGILEWGIFNSKIKAFYFSHRHISKYKMVPENREIVTQVSLLIDEGVLEKMGDLPHLFYRMKTWGYKTLEGGPSKWWFWLLYKNHNFFAFLAFAISLLSLLISIINFYSSTHFL
jgi:hypothetical protein